jgi:hypothetical protein
MLRADVFALASLLCACAVHRGPPPSPPAQTPADVDEDGIRMLLPSADGGTSFRLGAGDPNDTPSFEIEQGTRASAQTEGALRFHRVAAHAVEYASGGEGQTVRLHIHASGGSQAATWRTQRGYLSSRSDVKNQEFTVYARFHGLAEPKRAMFTLKIRGGEHTTRDGDRASCTMMTLQDPATGAATRFGKELVHPRYDYVRLEPRFEAHLTEDAWAGLKLVSYAAPGDPARVVNRLYLDTHPFDRAGRPANGWRLFAEYIDVEGANTGQYSKLVDWGGWQTTFRTDGVSVVDFAFLSVREIVPPQD